VKIVRDAADTHGTHGTEATVLVAAEPGAHAGTRARVAQAILANGPSTATDLADRLGLTPAAVRRHLDALIAEGVVATRDDRRPTHRGRGRPAKLYALTDGGRDRFYQAYDDLAAAALRFLRDQVGEAAVGEFARQRVAALEDRYRQAVADAAPERRTVALALALTADGYAASTEAVPRAGGVQLCQHHCPVAHVAEQFPELCEAETEVFARLLGTHVQRLATIAHGDGVCTTFVPAPTTPSGHTAGRNVTG
jgi:predicted ArsR family transcriptional regulator